MNVSGEVVIVKSLSYILLLMVHERCETNIFVHINVCFSFFVCFFVYPSLVLFVVY
jgi:hypothetical protein